MFNNLKIFLLIASLLGGFGQPFIFNGALAADFHSPRTDALGGAGHASPLLTDSIYLNPSFTSFIQTHAISVDYLSYRADATVNTAAGVSDFYGHNFNVSILDGGAESLFQAGVGYTKTDTNTMVHIGASKSFLERFGAGLGTKFIFPNDNSGTTRIIDGTLAFTTLLSSWFQSAVIVDNLFEAGKDRGFYREFILGTKFNVDSILLIYLDPNLTPTYPTDDTRFGYQAGIEFPFFKELFLRIGQFRNSNIPYQNQRGNGYGLGLGWIAPKISFDYAFSHSTNPLPANSHNFQIAIYF